MAFPKHRGLLIQQWWMRKKLLDYLESLRNSNGDYLKSYLKDKTLYCITGGNPAPCISAQRMYDADEVRFDGQELEPMDTEDFPPKLEDVRGILIDELKKEVGLLFPDEEIEAFKIFDVNHFPHRPQEFPTYGRAEVKKVAEKLGYRPTKVNEIVNEWAELMKSLSSDQHMCQRPINKLDSGIFWSSLLEEGVINSDVLKSFITHLLAIPTGSAEAERDKKHILKLKVEI